MKKALFTLILSIYSIPAHTQTNYCAAIRGNGELIPAHWSALSKLVEYNGLPEALAGGSSASVTSFLIESIAQNDSVKSEFDSKTWLKQSLLLKSVYPYFQLLGEDSKALNAIEFINKLKDKNSSLSQKLTSTVSKNDEIGPIIKSVGKYQNLLNLEPLKRLSQNTLYFKDKLITAVKTFGKFDAKEDDLLFFRDGLIDFKSFAVLIGQIGDFYAGNTSVESKKALADFLESCYLQSSDKIWVELEDSCKLKFKKSFKAHLNSKMQNKRVFEKIGHTTPSFMTTSVIHGEEGVNKFHEYMKAYAGAEEDKAYGDFSLDIDKNLSFGYWGKEADLLKAEVNLTDYQNQNDLKSLEFLSLGEASWFEVLSTSPAEPGLANIQKIPQNNSKESVLKEYYKPIFNKGKLTPDLNRWSNINYRTDMVSAGGWSDLHPSLILKSYGCHNVVYVTRTDGESVFAQQVFLRLSGEKEKVSFWKNIAENNKTGWEITSEIEDTSWNRLYNLKNPDSSLNLSIRETDAVYCTNWNDFDTFKGEVSSLIEDAYNAPVFASDNNPLIINRELEGLENSSFPGCN